MIKWIVSILVVIALLCLGWYFFSSSRSEQEVSVKDAPIPDQQIGKSPPARLAVNKKICLNMIVKNESKVIQRCLDSIKPLIDYWVIVDTGSTDGTQKIIKKHLKDIPGELHQSTWTNFAVNRNEALKLAQSKGDYILLMDADDVLEFDDDFQPMHLTKDLYNMWRGPHGVTYIKPQLIKAGLPWKWVGVTHEYLGCDQYYIDETLQNVRYVTMDDGAGWTDPKKFQKNIELLEAGLKEEPGNHRYVFYLAESYRAVGEKGKALEWYQKAVKMNGWQEEVFWSLLQIGHHLREIGLPASMVIEAYKNAHDFRPHRVEPIYALAEFYNQEKRYEEAYACINEWESSPKFAQKDSLFNQDWMEQYGLLLQLSICTFYLGRHQEAVAACNTLLAQENAPEWARNLAEFNRKFPLEKLQARVKADNKKTSRKA